MTEVLSQFFFVDPCRFRGGIEGGQYGIARLLGGGAHPPGYVLAGGGEPRFEGLEAGVQVFETCFGLADLFTDFVGDSSAEFIAGLRGEQQSGRHAQRKARCGGGEKRKC